MTPILNKLKPAETAETKIKSKKDSKATLQKKIDWYSNDDNWRIIKDGKKNEGEYYWNRDNGKIEYLDYKTKKWLFHAYTGMDVDDTWSMVTHLRGAKDYKILELKDELNGPVIIGTLSQLQAKQSELEPSEPPTLNGTYDGECISQQGETYIWNKAMFWQAGEGEWVKLDK